MAAALKFKLKGAEYEAVPVKLERKKLYGWTDVVATDASGEACRTAQVDPDGELLIPPGAVKQGILDEDGAWVERSELVAVDADGKELPIVPSSFGQTIELGEPATSEEFLDHVWKSVYQLNNADLAAALGDGIYPFTFNYRADVSPDDGYLLAAGGKAYLFDGGAVVRDVDMRAASGQDGRGSAARPGPASLEAVPRHDEGRPAVT